MHRVILRPHAKSRIRRADPCHKRLETTVLVSATIRMASTPCGSGGLDLGLHVLWGCRLRVQRIKLCDGLPEPSSGIAAVAFTVGLEEIHEILNLGALLGSERVKLLDEHLLSACVHGVTLQQMALEINVQTARGRVQRSRPAADRRRS